MPVRIIRTVMVFVISFFAYKFLDVIFDLLKSRFKERSANEDKEVIETEFVDKTDGDNKKDM